MTASSKSIEALAKAAFAVFNELVKAGFTEEQAMEFTKHVMSVTMTPALQKMPEVLP